MKEYILTSFGLLQICSRKEMILCQRKLITFCDGMAWHGMALMLSDNVFIDNCY